MLTLKSLFARIASSKYLVVICAVAVFVAAALIMHHPSKIISSAKAVEARSPGVGAPMGARQMSWSDKWYEVHKAIPESASENTQAF